MGNTKDNNWVKCKTPPNKGGTDEAVSQGERGKGFTLQRKESEKTNSHIPLPFLQSGVKVLTRDV
jgi:hypothetical protein